MSPLTKKLHKNLFNILCFVIITYVTLYDHHGIALHFLNKRFQIFSNINITTFFYKLLSDHLDHRDHRHTSKTDVLHTTKKNILIALLKIGSIVKLMQLFYEGVTSAPPERVQSHGFILENTCMRLNSC